MYSWYERVFNVNKTNGTLTITPVSVPATSITLNASSQNLITGESFTLTATVEPAKTTDTVVWSSSNEAVATVSDGTVTAAKAGSYRNHCYSRKRKSNMYCYSF